MSTTPKKYRVICVDCGIEFEIGKTAYNNHNKNSNLQYRCKSCRCIYYAKLNKIRWLDKSEKERVNFSKKMKDIYNQLSEKDKLIHKEKSISYWVNMSDKDKQLYIDYCKELWRNRSEEYKIKFISNLRDNLNNWRKNIDIVSKNQIYQKISDKNKQYWSNLSEEERNKRIDLLQYERDKWWSTASKDQLIDHKIKSIKYWESLSQEEREEYRQTKIDEWKNRFNNEYIKIYFNTSLGKVNSETIKNNKSPSELDFINYLNINDLMYNFQYMNYTYPDYFYEIFDKSKNPYHVWDFIIHTINGDVLIDIDGSEHFIPEGEFITKDGIDVGKRIKENDTKRPYQTDGLDAYIILAYDDTINMNTLVYIIKDNKFIIVKDLLNYLNIMNLSNTEFKKLMNIGGN